MSIYVLCLSVNRLLLGFSHLRQVTNLSGRQCFQGECDLNEKWPSVFLERLLVPVNWFWRDRQVSGNELRRY